MKKIFFLLLPVLICLAIFFTIQSRDFHFHEFVSVVSSWEFADSLDAFVDMKNTFSYVGSVWSRFRDSTGFWDTIGLIGDLIINIIVGLGQLVYATAILLIDFVDNIIQIVEYLFFYEHTPNENLFPNGSGGGAGGSW